jgi:hypothetical protein
MAAFMADYELFQIEITRTYGKNEWRDDIRKLFRKSGIEGNIQLIYSRKKNISFFFLGKSTVFLFGDSQIVRFSLKFIFDIFYFFFF